MISVVLGLGSNKSFKTDSPIVTLEKACRDLSLILSNVRLSSVYKTKAMYVEDQEDFYNMVLEGKTQLTPEALLKKIHEIEAKYGRNRAKEIRFGPRTLDIDIELYGDEVISTENLEIPHPRLKERAFVLHPLLEILPESAEPIGKRKFCQFIQNLNDDIQLVAKPFDVST